MGSLGGGGMDQVAASVSNMIFGRLCFLLPVSPSAALQHLVKYPRCLWGAALRYRVWEDSEKWSMGEGSKVFAGGGGPSESSIGHVLLLLPTPFLFDVYVTNGIDEMFDSI